LPSKCYNIIYTIIIRKKDSLKSEDSLKRAFGNFTIFYPYEKAICQAVLLPVPKTKVTELTYDELLKIESERAMGNLGSSNK
jgi:dUTP pyrophosphatase